MVECVRLDEADVRESVELRVIAGAGQCLGRAVDGENFVRLACEMKRERSVIAEAVESSAACELSDSTTILPLVQERAGLLAGPRRGEKLHAVLLDGYLPRHLSVQDLSVALESFFRAKRDVIARENAIGVGD